MLSDFDYHYSVYIDKNIGLVSTMIIKSEYQAQDMNDAVRVKTRNMNAVDEYRPETWIYYKHIAGEYHETDTPMTVVSMDTTETIIFNKENLKTHRTTRKEYSYGTKKYEELVERYPDKELLIKGILNPCDIQVAIEAKEGTILSYDKSFVESNEYSLMERLQNWIYGMYSRWYQRQYNINNKYFNIAFWGTFYPKLVEALMTIRMEMCLTNEAHSYHYRRFLASHGFLDFYLDQLTPKQAIIFYKNIRWVERYVGQKHTQKWLIEKILTMRNIPLSEYNMLQRDSDIDDTAKVTPVFEKIPLNGLEYFNPELDTLSLKNVLDKEDPLAPYNPKERDNLESIAYKNTSGSLDSFTKTKILESKVIDYSGSEQFTLERTLIDTWIEMAHRGLYKAYIMVNHPLTGELIPLSGKDALILYTYCIYKYYGIKDNCIPDYTIGIIPRLEQPTREELEKSVPDPALVDERFKNFIESQYLKIKPIIDTFSFYEQAHELFKRFNDGINAVNEDEHLDGRAYKEMMFYRLYATKVVSFRTPKIQNFTQFLDSISVNLRDVVNKNDYLKIAEDIYKRITGLNNVKTNSLYNTHKAMIQLLTKLSSYSVHYIREINEFPITYTNMRALRLDGGGRKRARYTGNLNEGTSISVVDTETKSHQSALDHDYTDNKIYTEPRIRGSAHADISVDVKNIEMPGNTIHLIHQVNTGTYCTMPADDLTGLENPGNLPPIPGMKAFLSLPLKERRKAIDYIGASLDWDPFPDNIETPKEDIRWNFQTNTIDGFDYNK